MKYQAGPPRSNWQTGADWLGRIFKLDFAVFDEIADRPSMTMGAAAVVLGASLLAGFGSWFWVLEHTNLNGVDAGRGFARTLVVGSLVQTAVWFLWVYIVHQLLTRGYGATVEFGSLVRTMGFAFAPVAGSILVAISKLAVPFGLIAFGAALLATNVAIERSGKMGVRETTLANLTGFTAFVIVMGIFANVGRVGPFGGVAPGILFFSLRF